MIVRLTERDAGPLPRVRNRNPPDGPRYAQPAGRRSDGRSPAAGAAAAPTPYRRPGDENDLPLDVHSVSPPLIVRQPTRPDRNIHADMEELLGA